MDYPKQEFSYKIIAATIVLIKMLTHGADQSVFFSYIYLHARGYYLKNVSVEHAQRFQDTYIKLNDVLLSGGSPNWTLEIIRRERRSPTGSMTNWYI